MSQYDSTNNGLAMLREASLVLQGYVVKYYEMNPACDDLIFGRELKKGMRVLSANNDDRTDLRGRNPRQYGFAAETLEKYNRWVTIDSVFEGGSGLVTFIAADDSGVKRHYATTRSSGWYVCSVPVANVPVFMVPITDDPKEMSDYLIKLMGDLGFENGTDAFRQTMMEAAEFASKLLQEFTLKPASSFGKDVTDESPDPILFEEYDLSDGSSVRIEPGSEIPADANIGTRRHIRQSDLNLAEATENAKTIRLTDAVSAYPKSGLKDLVGDMDVTAFKDSEPFAVDLETTPPSEVLDLDTEKN